MRKYPPYIKIMIPDVATIAESICISLNTINVLFINLIPKMEWNSARRSGSTKNIPC